MKNFSSNTRRENEMMRLILTTFAGVVFGIFLGVSFPTLPLTKVKLPSNLFGLIDLTYIEDKYSGFSNEDPLNVLSILGATKVVHKGILTQRLSQMLTSIIILA
ncbi:hypothetical protein P3S68_013988 [Capsicum galapagoense]